MLTLITGRGKSGKTTRLLEMVRDCPAQGMAQRILIVPEQLSHQTERLLSATCGDGISFVSEVLSFTRLQDRVCSIYGGGATKILDQGGRILTARLALSSVLSRLKVFAPAAARSEFLQKIVAIIDEFKSYDVSPEQLFAASRNSENLFAQKLQELGTILSAYNAVMARGCCDPRDKLTLLRQQLYDTDYAEHRYFFVDGFSDFSAQELHVLEALLRQSPHVVVTVPWENCDQEIFSTGWETVERLLRMAKGLGQKTEMIVVDHRRDLPPELTYLEQNLFARQGAPYSGTCDGIQLLSAHDLLEECRHCASELRRLAMSGLRWRDMAVAAGNIAEYGSLMEEICRDYGIPLYTGIKAPLTAHPAAAFVLCAMEAALEGMDTETVLAYLKTGYSGITADDCDRVENYSYVWKIRGQKWASVWTEHPEGYDRTVTTEVQEELDALNKAKDQALEPLFHLRTALKTGGNVKEQIMGVYRFLEETELFSQINEQIRQFSDEGQQEAAQETAQIWNTLMQCLQQIVSVLGELSIKGGELLKIFRLALEQYEVGTIPAVLDAVHFGSVDSLRGMEPKILFVLGCGEGSIPPRPETGSLLSEQERMVLRDQLHIALAPDSFRSMEKQLFLVYCAFTAPSCRLYISYTEDAEQEHAPSFLLERILTLFPEVSVQRFSLRPWEHMTPEMLAELFFIAEQNGRTGLHDSIRQTAPHCKALEDHIIAAETAALPRDLIVPERFTKKLFGLPVKLTASRLDSLGSCPLSFFLNYGLKARPRKAAVFDATEFGTFLHYMMEHTVDQMVQALPPSASESHRLVQQYMEPYLATRLRDTEILSDRQKYIFERNGVEVEQLLLGIAQEFAASDFRPCAYELQFGNGKKLEGVSVSGSLGEGVLEGTVDRVDVWKDREQEYFRIIDYKSGSGTKFDYTKLYGGLGMQLMLYLFTLARVGIPGVSEHPVPAGALYYPAHKLMKSSKHPIKTDREEQTLRKDDIKCTGLLLGDETVLDAMAHDEKGRKQLPISSKKDSPRDFCITPKQMDVLEAFIHRRMGEAVDKVCAGEFTPEPFYRGPDNNPCIYCDYVDICQKDDSFCASFYHPTLHAKDFWNLIGGEEDE